MSSRFGNLLQNAKLLVDSSDISDKPQLERELGQIANETNLLRSRFTDQGLNATGHYFLAQSGANTQETIEELKNLDTRITFQPAEKSTKNDIESHLNQVQKDITFGTIEESRRNTQDVFLDRLDHDLHHNTRKAQNEILEDWDYEQEDLMFGRTTLGSEKHDKFNKQKTAYTTIIKQFNEKRLLSDRLDVIQEFKKASSSIDCDNSQKKLIYDSWNIASELTNVISGKNNYLKNTNDLHANVKLNRCLIRSAKSYLEKEYLAFINEKLQENPREARVGGVPDLRLRIGAFVRLIFKKGDSWIDQNLEIVNDTPIWLLVYLYLRCGKPELVSGLIDTQALFTSAPDFPSYFRDYIGSENGLVAEETRQAVLQEYQRMVYGHAPADPYKVLLYKIIGRCEIPKGYASTVITTIEDYMWVELALVREEVQDDRNSLEKYRLSDFQKKINDSGRKHFDPSGNNPWFYFKILLLSIQLEKAVEFLYDVDSFRLEAVHFAIALTYNGLIRIPHKHCGYYTNLLVIEELDGSLSLNFVRLITQYVRLFLSDDHDSALNYLYLITLYPTEDMVELCREQICNYIIRHNNYTYILGSPESRRGYLDKFKPLLGIELYDVDNYRRYILAPIAQKLEAQGKYEDAVKIYELGEQYTEALKVLNRQLDYALNREGRDVLEQKKFDSHLIEVSMSILKNYKNSFIQCDDTVLFNHNVLLKFLQATNFYESGNADETIKTIKLTKILPESGNYKDIKIAVDVFNANKDYSFRKHISRILLMTMESYDQLKRLYSQRNILNQSNTATIREETAGLLSFVGTIDFQIPPEIVRKLNKLDAITY